MEKNDSKKSIEVEGAKVPESNIIMNLIEKYRHKIDPEQLNSLLYLVNLIVEEEKKEVKNEDENRKSFKL